MSVDNGEMLVITNPETQEEQECRIVYLGDPGTMDSAWASNSYARAALLGSGIQERVPEPVDPEACAVERQNVRAGHDWSGDACAAWISGLESSGRRKETQRDHYRLRLEDEIELLR